MGSDRQSGSGAWALGAIFAHEFDFRLVAEREGLRFGGDFRFAFLVVLMHVDSDRVAIDRGYLAVDAMMVVTMFLDRRVVGPNDSARNQRPDHQSHYNQT